MAATLCDNVQGARGGSSAAVPACTRRGQATSSMPANKELWLSLATGLHGQLWGPGWRSGPPFGASLPREPCSDPGPCSLEPASLVSASLASPGSGRGTPSRGGRGLGPLGENWVELRGCRKAWPPAKGTASVSRSDRPMRAATGLASARGCWAGARCRQEASKCLRICTVGEKQNQRGSPCSSGITALPGAPKAAVHSKLAREVGGSRPLDCSQVV